MEFGDRESDDIRSVDGSGADVVGRGNTESDADAGGGIALAGCATGMCGVIDPFGEVVEYFMNIF